MLLFLNLLSVEAILHVVNLAGNQFADTSLLLSAFLRFVLFIHNLHAVLDVIALLDALVHSYLGCRGDEELELGELSDLSIQCLDRPLSFYSKCVVVFFATGPDVKEFIVVFQDLPG